MANPPPKPSILSTVTSLAVTATAYAGSTVLSVQKQLTIPKIAMPTKISDRVYGLCTSEQSVSSELGKDPRLAPGEAAERLYGKHKISVSEKKASPDRVPATQEDLERAYRCGSFGPTRPSELFLRIYHDALLTLEHDPLMGCVSPPLMGSCGTMPLTIISVLPDICRHMSNLISRAQQEVFLATNYWIDSDASKLITDGIKELSRRAGQRGGRAVVKVLYDRGNAKQVVKNHQPVPVEVYTKKPISLPSPKEAPNVDIQVINFHRPAVGTFHSKFMVVDRKIAVISSNNIQDNDNFEMMTHLEGPIVDSFYDVCLISWNNALTPSLPRINNPAATVMTSTFQDPTFLALFDHSQTVHRSAEQDDGELMPLHAPGDPHFDTTIAAEYKRMLSNIAPRQSKTRMDRITEHLNLATHQDRVGNAPECAEEDEMIPFIPHKVHEPFPIALVNRKPWGAPNHSCVDTPQVEAWLSAVRNAEKSVFIQTPNLNAVPLIPELVAAVKRGIEVTYYVCLGYNDAGELLPFQGGTNEMVASKLYGQLQPDEKKRLHVGYYVGKDQTAPIHNKFKSRSCHIKLMIVDDHIGIQGNGNQDTQSYYHSQEVNIMIDSELICRDWKEGIRRNQNTHLYGMASQEDGVWRDGQGTEAPGAIGKDPGRFSWAKGVVGAIQRVRGVGGF